MARFFEIFCQTVDRIAGVLIALVTLLVVGSAIGRYAFTWPIPDAFDVSRLLIGACIMWGFAVVGYRGGHISVDLLVEMVGRTSRRWIDVFAWAVTLFFCVLMSWKMFERVLSAMRSNEATFDLRLPVWPFLGLIWLGAVAAIVTVSVRLVQLATGQTDPLPPENERPADGEW